MIDGLISGDNVGRMAAEGTAGGFMSVMQGGTFRDGFIGAAISKGGEGAIRGLVAEELRRPSRVAPSLQRRLAALAHN